MPEPVTVVAFHFGDYCGQGREYLAALRRMIQVNLPAGYPGEFACLTNDPAFEVPGWRMIVRDFPNRVHEKMRIYHSSTIPAGQWCIYFDLDTLPVGPLEDLFAWRGEPGEFGVLEDFLILGMSCPNLCAWRSGEQDHIWESWVQAGCPTDGIYWDQEWTHEQTLNNRCLLNREFPGHFRSYKNHCQHSAPDGARVVIFHGDPRPHTLGGWVEKVRQGRSLVSSLQLCPNIADSDIVRHVREAESDTDAEWLVEGTPVHGDALIVCGGPSMRDDLVEIKCRQQSGAHVFACNGAHRVVTEAGIDADLVLLDARADNARFCSSLHMQTAWLASQCHSDVVEAAKNAGADIVRWHSYRDDLNDGTRTLIGAGTTVGLQAMAIAYALGYRRLHVYGMDSCYQGGEHHAYAQPENEGERLMEAELDGKEYACAPWMVIQAREFATLAEWLVNEGAEVIVHGAGLVPDIAAAMLRDSAAKTEGLAE